MAARGVSLLKFVGTVSLGLLTGLSVTLSTLTIPTLLTLPSADTAARAFDSLTTTAKTQLHVLTTLSGSAFALAFFLSPRAHRHPYLIYTSLLVLGSRLVASDLVAPNLSLSPPPQNTSSTSSSNKAPAARKQKKEQAAAAARARMEASYEVLGAAGSDAHSEEGAGSASGEELDTLEEENENENANGEEVRARVEAFLKKQVVQSAVSGLGFLLAVVGIWGDGVVPVYGQTVIIGV